MARHIHADKMIEAANDTSIEWQWELAKGDLGSWVDCEVECGMTPVFLPDIIYRKKPREFKEGHWYPCIHNKNPAVVRYKDAEFDLDGYVLFDRDFSWIGESLGKLKFG